MSVNPVEISNKISTIPLNKLVKARAILEIAIESHSPKHIFGLFSGGHDSCQTLHRFAHSPGER